MILYLAPAGRESFSGGVRKLYDHVDILNGAGVRARIVRSDVVDPVTISPKDLIVVPEIFGDVLSKLAPTVAKVSFNQNAYLSWTDVADVEHHPYLNTPSLLGVLCVSMDNYYLLRQTFPDLEIKHYRPWINVGDRFKFGPWPRERKICYFARKRAEISTVVLGALYARGRIDSSWAVVCLDGMTDEEIAGHLSTAAIFLSFSKLEGIGTPPLEAMLSGAMVVGFTGRGGDEYQNHFRACVVEENVVQFVSGVSAAISDVEVGISGVNVEALVATAEFIGERYSQRNEESSIVEIMEGYLSRARSLLLP